MGFHLIEQATAPPAEKPATGIRCPGVQTPIGAPFGKAILSSKYWDADTKQSYYGFRYYGPEIGRWTSSDPIGEDGGFNLYCFIENNIINEWDLYGLLFGWGKPKSKCPEGQVYTFKDMAYIPNADGCSNPFKDWVGKIVTEIVPGLPPYSGNPDMPWDGASFFNACEYHDYCYSDCSKSKEDCDKGLRDRAKASCDNAASNKIFSTKKEKKKWIKNCKSWANAYYKAVNKWGGSAYDNRQKGACECQCKLFVDNRMGITCIGDGTYIYPPDECPPCKKYQ